MKIFPAIDLYQGQAVRLYKGDYEQMKIYSNEPWLFAQKFAQNGAKYLHLVDLEGAKDGNTANMETIAKIMQASGLFCELGGGIRSMEVIDKYLALGVDRVILGTKAVEDPLFAKAAAEKYSDKIAVGIDIKDDRVAIKGWKETAAYTTDEFFALMCDYGVKYAICTDISKDGAMKGTNVELYRRLKEKYPINLTASGGVSTLADIRQLNEINIYAAIIGKAYYEGKIDLKEAVKLGGEQ